MSKRRIVKKREAVPSRRRHWVRWRGDHRRVSLELRFGPRPVWRARADDRWWAMVADRILKDCYEADRLQPWVYGDSPIVRALRQMEPHPGLRA